MYTIFATVHKITLNEIKNSRQDTQYVARVDERLPAHRCGRGAPHSFWLTLAEGAPPFTLRRCGHGWECMGLMPSVGGALPVAAAIIASPVVVAVVTSQSSSHRGRHRRPVVIIIVDISLRLSPRLSSCRCRCRRRSRRHLRWRRLGTMGSVGRYVGDGVDAVACRKWCGSWPHDQG